MITSCKSVSQRVQQSIPCAGIGNVRDGMHPVQERLAMAHGSQVRVPCFRIANLNTWSLSCLGFVKPCHLRSDCDLQFCDMCSVDSARLDLSCLCTPCCARKQRRPARQKLKRLLLAIFGEYKHSILAPTGALTGCIDQCILRCLLMLIAWPIAVGHLFSVVC